MTFLLCSTDDDSDWKASDVGMDSEEAKSFVDDASETSDFSSNSKSRSNKLFSGLVVGCVSFLFIFAAFVLIIDRFTSGHYVDELGKSGSGTKADKPVDQEHSEIKRIQIENYRKGNALMLNFHITHHGGTTLCAWAAKNGPVPSFACMDPKDTVLPEEVVPAFSAPHLPWLRDETDSWVPQIRNYFHFVSWEWAAQQNLARSVYATNWENPNLVSIIVMRNPIHRFMTTVHAGHGPKNKTADEWWEFANSAFTDNYALTKIANREGCCQGKDTSENYVELAKLYLKRFTFILDQDCLDDNLETLSSILNLTYVRISANYHGKHPPPRQYMNNDTLYSYLIQRNARDIHLYEWAKTQSLVRCNPARPVVNMTDLDL